MKKAFYICLTILAAFILMSHNVHATDIGANVEFYTSIDGRFGTSSWECDTAASNCPQSVLGSNWYYRFFTDAPVSFYDLYIRIPKIKYKKGDWLVVPFSFAFSGYQGGNQTGLYRFNYGGASPSAMKADLVDIEYEEFDGNTQNAYFYFVFWDDWDATTVSGPPNFVLNSGIQGTPVLKIAPGYAGGNTSINIGRVQVWKTTVGSDYSSQLNEIKNAIQEQNDEQTQATEDARDNAAQDAESSSQDAAQGTTALLSAIGSAVSVITNASPTNCLINGNMGHLNIGNIDLCANPVPSFVSVIGSLILILITVPLAISLFNRFISLFRSFTG